MATLVPQLTSSYRGRIAPSPTGFLHLGHARTFWTAWQRACAAGGAMVMRIEDLDRERSKSLYVDAALEDMRWLGIRWHEGPERGGPYGPYLQSKRGGLYLEVWRKLLEAGAIYPCRCSRKDLQEALSAPHEGREVTDSLDDEPVYPGTCRNRKGELPRLRDPRDIWLPEPGKSNWRFRVPDGEVIEFNDENLGPQRFEAGRDFGDFLVWRKDGTPSYQLACVADDAMMRITEVVRGADLLKSTARQILLYRALGITPPAFYHCRLVLDHNGKRLAKRHDALSLRMLRKQGLTPLKILAAEVPMEE